MFIHAYLSKQYPQVLLPPMPYKQCKKASVEQKNLLKRTRIYDRYFKQLLRWGGSEEVRGDYLLVQFLTQHDRREFDNIIK
jgi:PX domain